MGFWQRIFRWFWPEIERFYTGEYCSKCGQSTYVLFGSREFDTRSGKPTEYRVFVTCGGHDNGTFYIPAYYYDRRHDYTYEELCELTADYGVNGYSGAAAVAAWDAAIWERVRSTIPKWTPHKSEIKPSPPDGT